MKLRIKGLITITARRDRNSVLIIVSDTRIGIPEEIRDKVLNSFLLPRKLEMAQAGDFQ
ncbi:ATP-binding protein [Candidatus Latescibacterota bacterium]